MSTVEVYRPKNHVVLLQHPVFLMGMMHPSILCVVFYKQAEQKLSI